jgi:hypothetical protein
MRRKTQVLPDQDLQLARVLLAGFVEEDRRGNRRTKYLEKGSHDEMEARQAIGRLLRSNRPLDRQLRGELADLFDPPAWGQRKIEFVSRRQGQHTDHVRNTQIASYVSHQVKGGSKSKRCDRKRSRQIRDFTGRGKENLE